MKHRCIRWLSDEPTGQKGASVHWASYVPETMSRAQEKFLQHRFNRRSIGVYHWCNDVSVQEKILSAPVEPVKHRCIASVQPVVSASAVRSPTATSGYERPDEPTLPRQEASVLPVIRRFTADRWCNGYKTRWPIYTPHPVHFKCAGVAEHSTTLEEHLQPP